MESEPKILEIRHDKPTTGISNVEYMLRMQFLLQASTIVQDPVLQSYYGREIKNIAKR